MNKLLRKHGNPPLFYQFFRKMKLTILILTASILSCLSAETYSQTTKLTIVSSNSTLLNVIRAIEEQSEFKFFYNEKVDVNMPVSVEVTGKPVTDILDKVLSNTLVKYKVLGRQIALYDKNEMEPFMSEQQSKKVTGKVTDSNGGSLPGVSVVVKGTTTGVITDSNGNYSLVNIPENATLQFSFVGMKTQEIKIGTQTSINVVLVEEAIGLDEVVAIGYGTQKKATVTGSIASINGEKLEMNPSSNFATALQGQLPGLVLNVSNGDPGNETVQMLIRGKATMGSTSVLTVIDGVAGGDITRLNPADVESVSILKDASAAIYGSQAANGVILVTTKRGKSGKPTINYSMNEAGTQPTKLQNMMDSWQYAVGENEYLINNGLAPKWTDNDINLFKNGTDPLQHPNINWYKVALKKWTPQQQHNISLSGGTDVIKYFISGQILNQDRIFINDDHKGLNRYQLRANIDAQVTKRLTVGVDMNYNNNIIENSYDGANMIIFMYMRSMLPNIVPFWPNGLPGNAPFGQNPALAASPSQYGYNLENDLGFNTKISFKLDLAQFTKGLFLEGYGDFANFSQNFERFFRAGYFYTYNPANGQYVQNVDGQTTQSPNLTETNNKSVGKTYNFKIGYQNSFGDNNIDAFAAAEQSQSNYSGFWAYRANYITNQLPVLSAGSSAGKDNGGTKSDAARLNYFGRFNYDYKGKYLLSTTLRYDGSQNFPENKRFGLFPGVSAGWLLSKESFIQDNYKFITLLKLKGSWGKMGNDAVPPFQYLATYTQGGGYYYGAPSTTLYSGIASSTTPNPNITWEVADTKNVGLESVLWNGLFGFNLDFFKSKRSNILVQPNATIPAYTGLNLPDENIGSVQNTGFELELTHSKIVNTDFSYAVNANMSYSHNKIIYFEESPNVPAYQKKTGYPIDSWMLYQANGLYQTQAEIDASPHLPNTAPGDIKYVDVNKDGKIDASDMVRENLSPTPQIMYGINLSAKYKNWQLSVLFQGQAQGKVMVMPEGLYMDKAFFNGRWQKQGDNLYPRSFNSDRSAVGNDALLSTFWMKNGSFLRLKNVELSYYLPKKYTDFVKLSNVRLFVNASNLCLLIDHVKIVDPETLNSVTSNQGLNVYPIQRLVNFGLNVTF